MTQQTAVETAPAGQEGSAGQEVHAAKEVQERVNEYWSRWAGEYDAHQRRRLRQEGEAELWGRIWGEMLPQPDAGPEGRPAEVLDIGTGSGHAAVVVASLGHRVTGIDLAEGMLEQARLHTGGAENPQFLTGDAAAPPFLPGSFDAITARYLLWTLRDPAEALARWLEVLRTGGVLGVVDSLWFPEGLAAGAGEAQSERSSHFAAAYAGAQQRMPLAEAGSIDVYAEQIRAAGFTEVTVEELTELYALDQARGVAPGHQVQMQYRIRAVKPAD